jgi:hypothetical protein
MSSVEFRAGGCEDKTWARSEESPLLEAVVRERLVKTQHAGKGLAVEQQVKLFYIHVDRKTEYSELNGKKVNGKVTPSL